MDDFRCTFCGRLRTEVRRLVPGPMVFICDQCLSACESALGASPDAIVSYLPPTAVPASAIPPPRFPGANPRACNFCGTDEESRRMIQGHLARICADCLLLSRDILTSAE